MSQIERPTTSRPSDTHDAPWRKLIHLSAGVVGGASVFAIASAGAILWYSTQPPAWDRSAITAQFDGISVASGRPPVCSVQYTVENHTDLDYALPTATAPYKVIEGEALQLDATFEWESGTAIQAGQKSTARIQFALSDYAAGADVEKINALLNRRFAQIEGFAVLDRNRRFDIRFPKPTRTQITAIDPAPGKRGHLREAR